MSAAPRVLVLGSVLGQAMGGVRRHNAELLPRAAALLQACGGSLSVLEGLEPCAFPLPESVERIGSQVPARPILRRAIAEGLALRKLLDERKAEGRPFHLVHTAHQPVPRALETPLSLLIHDLRALSKSHSPFSRRLIARELLGKSARRACCLMTVSESMADEIAQTLDLEPERIDVIVNGADHFTPLPRVAEPRGPLLCVGHLEPRKHQELLLRTLALDPSLPPVDFVGAAKGDELQRLQTLASELDLKSRARFLGAVSDSELGELYAATRCVVLPSNLEGFGIVAVEAMRARAPLAISRIPAHLEVCPAQVPSFEPSPEDCARAIHAALRQSPAQLLQNEAATQRYTWEAAAQRLVDSWFAGLAR